MKTIFLLKIFPQMRKIFQSWATLKKEEANIIIKKKYITNSRCFLRGQKIKPSGILLHSPGVSSRDWKWLWRRWNTSTANACVHFILTVDECIQILPTKTRCWGCGRGEKGSANATHIQIEVCEPAGHQYKNHEIVSYNVVANHEYMQKIWKRAMLLCVQLCEEFSIDTSRIIDHSEAAKMGLASKHKDLTHWISLHGLTMNDFRRDVGAILRGWNE